MKKFKKLFIGVLSIISALSFCLLSGSRNAEIDNAETNAAVLNNNAFNYISLSQPGEKGQPGQVIDDSKFTTIDNKTYIITNNSVTINFKTLQFNYTLNIGTVLDNFHPYPKVVTLEKGADDKYPESFTIDGVDGVYYYAVTNGNVYIYNSPITQTSAPIVSSASSDLISYELDGETHKITFIFAYTTNGDGYVDDSNQPAKSCEFNFRVASQDFFLSFQKPVINFFKLTEPVVMFNTFKLDDDDNPYPVEKSLAPNQIFDKLQIEFLNNDYTEGNPLFFKINFNGFVYEYKLYSKVIDGDNLLFVEYTDEYSSASENIDYNNSESLATVITPLGGGEFTIEEQNKVYAKNASDDNKFSIIFTKTGRYSIEIYDSTYNLKMPNANYYSTSFYIREAGASVTPFQNIYVVAETISDSGEHIDYIVSDSTLNYSTRITVKNLGDFGLDQTTGQEIKLEDVIENIVVKRTDFGIDTVETVDTIYTVADILANLKNNDFVLEYHDDAYYQVLVNAKEPDDPLVEVEDPVYYVFTIVKFAKTTFTFGDVIYEASVPYHTDIRKYTNKIDSQMNFNIKFTTSSEIPVELEKTFINRFTIKFGIKKVLIEEFTPEPEEENEKVPDGVYLKVYGVGDITVTLTYNGVSETFILNSEEDNNIISRTEYGKYEIKVVDSMGTTASYSVNFKKKLNTSALVLIVLGSIIGTCVLLFVMKARGKVATR